MKKETSKWYELAQKDWEMMEIAWEHRKYAYALLFAQQAVEKIIKAYIVEYLKKSPRKIHIIEELIKEAKLDLSEIKNPKVKELSKAYARVRYPDLSATHYESRAQVNELVVMAKSVYTWIEKKLKKN